MTDSPAPRPRRHAGTSSIDQQAWPSRPRPPDSTPSSASIFGVETIERFLHSSYDQFAGRATIPNFLPLLAERFARQRLNALARVEGKITDDKPTVLFLCTHNAGRSQMALGFFTHLAGDQRRGLVGRLRTRQRNQPRGRSPPWPRSASTSPANSPSPGPTKSSGPPTSSSPWAAATPARSSPENATRTGNCPTRLAKPSMRCDPSATTSKPASALAGRTERRRPMTTPPAPTVLFTCVGNAGKSMIAQALLRHTGTVVRFRTMAQMVSNYRRFTRSMRIVLSHNIIISHTCTNQPSLAPEPFRSSQMAR